MNFASHFFHKPTTGLGGSKLDIVLFPQPRDTNCVMLFLGARRLVALSARSLAKSRAALITSYSREMAHVITAVKGAEADLVPIKTALLSVSDKTGLIDLGKALAARGVKVHFVDTRYDHGIAFLERYRLGLALALLQ